MTEKTINIDDPNLVNGRDLYDYLEINRAFAGWIKTNIARYDFKEGKDYITYNRVKDEKHGTTKILEYMLTPEMTKELLMLEKNEKGKQAREYFVGKEVLANKLRYEPDYYINLIKSFKKEDK